MVDKEHVTVDVPRKFHRRMAAIIDTVQTGMWEAGVHDLLGYATDYAFRQERGLQTLVLKSKNRSATYVCTGTRSCVIRTLIDKL